MNRALRFAAVVCFAGGAACGPVVATPPIGGGSLSPEPTAVGAPAGAGSSLSIDARGGLVQSPDGRLTVRVPPDALTTPAEFSIQPLSNQAPRGVGAAYRLGPEGTSFSNPVQLTFHVEEGAGPIETLGISYQRASGYWVAAQNVVRDPAARTLTVATGHFSDWTIVLNPPPKGRDLLGDIVLHHGTEIPFVATGSATLHFMGEDASDAVYLVTGSISVPASFSFGDSTCVPDSQEKSLSDSVAEISKATGVFRWGINGVWRLTCTDSLSQVTTPLIYTTFDSLGINLQRCARSYTGTPLVSEDRIQGTYEIDCATEGLVTGTWDFRSCTSLGNGALCGDSMTCHVGLCTASRTVSGARQITYWPESGATAPQAAPDVGTSSVEARSPDGLGGWVSYPGTIDAAGSYSIPAVPGGAYLLVLTEGSGLERSTETSASSVDLGYDVLGRSDLARATGTTAITIDASGLDPWNQDRDQVQLTSIDANLEDVAFAGTQLTTGATTGSTVEDWFAPVGGAGPFGLLAAADTLQVHQLSTRTVTIGPDTYSYGAAATAGSLTGIALVDQTPATLTPVLSTQPQSGSVAVDWRRSQFEALQAAMSPSGTTDATAHALLLDAVPHPLVSPAPLGAAAALVRLTLPAGGDLDLGSLSYGQFLNAALWNERLGVGFRVHVSYLAPGATTPVDMVATTGWRQELAAAPSPLVPTVGPVGAPLINGLDAFSAQSGVGVTPTLAWSAPSLGTPTHYELELYELSEQGGASLSTRTAVFLSSATQVSVPSGFLTAGSTYFARLVARVEPGSFATAPLRTSNTGAFAESLTATFAP